MDRRKFMQGAAAVVGATLIPKAAYSAPELKEYGKSVSITRMQLENTLLTPEQIGRKMAEELAKAMMMTREQMAANVMTRAFWDDDKDVFRLEGITAEELYER